LGWFWNQTEWLLWFKPRLPAGYLDLGLTLLWNTVAATHYPPKSNANMTHCLTAAENNQCRPCWKYQWKAHQPPPHCHPSSIILCQCLNLHLLVSRNEVISTRGSCCLKPLIQAFRVYSRDVLPLLLAWKLSMTMGHNEVCTEEVMTTSSIYRFNQFPNTLPKCTGRIHCSITRCWMRSGRSLQPPEHYLIDCRYMIEVSPNNWGFNMWPMQVPKIVLDSNVNQQIQIRECHNSAGITRVLHIGIKLNDIYWLLEMEACNRLGKVCRLLDKE